MKTQRKTQQKHTDDHQVPDAYLDNVNSFKALTSLTSLATPATAVATPQGVVAHDNIIGVNWPHLDGRYRDNPSFRRRLCPDPDRERLYAASGPAVTVQGYAAWSVQRLRHLLTTTFAPLELPVSYSRDRREHTADPRTAHAIKAYSAMFEDSYDDLVLTHGRKQGLVAATIERRHTEQITHYSFFQALTSVYALRNVYVTPYPLPPALDRATLPEAQAWFAVLAAWRLCYTRQTFLGLPLQPNIHGVAWTRQGRVFINWPRFLKSDAWALQGTVPDPDELLVAIRRLPRDLGLPKKAFQELTVNDDLDDIALFTGAAPDNELGNQLGYYGRRKATPQTLSTLLNPWDFRDRPQCGDLAWLRKQGTRKYVVRKRALARARKTQDLARARAVRDGTTLEEARRRINAENSTRQAHVTSFDFCLYDYLPEHIRSKGVWFPENMVETLHVITRDNRHFVAWPLYLNKDLAVRSNADYESVHRTLSKLAVVSRFTDPDPEKQDLDIVRQKSVLSCVQEMDEANWELATKQVITEYADMLLNEGSVGYAASKRIRDLVQRRVNAIRRADPRAASSTRWFSDLRIHLRRSYSAADLRRKVRAALPGRNEGKPQLYNFVSQFALEHFQRDARGGTDTSLSPYPQQFAPAPYILAWATFGLSITDVLIRAKKRITPSLRDYTPADDLVIIRKYCTRVRMTAKEKEDLLSTLDQQRDGTHSMTQAAARARRLNEYIALVTPPKGRDQYLVGKHRGWTFNQNPEEFEAWCRRVHALAGFGYLYNRLSPKLREAVDVNRIYTYLRDVTSKTLLSTPPPTTHYFSEYRYARLGALFETLA